MSLLFNVFFCHSDCMTDLGTFATVGQLLNTAVSTARTIREFARDSSDTTLKSDISSLYDTLLDIKAKMLGDNEQNLLLKRELEKLEETNKELREQLRFKGQVIRRNGYVFIDGDDEPLCSRCSDVDNKPVHLLSIRKQGEGDVAVCPQCKSQHRHYRTRTSVEDLIKSGAKFS